METIDEEEMKEQLAEEMAKYEDEGYFKRLFKMFAGLGRPHASREYKEAVIELQRQIAPILAILVPLVGAAILFVVTAMGGSSEQKINVEIAQVEEEKPLDEIEQPPETEPPPDMDVDVQMDSPNVSPVEAAEVAPPTAEPQSVKVASVDAMLMIKSPVTMKSVAGTARNAGVRGVYTKGGAQYGDANTERAVMKALRWLKATQSADGSWGTKPELGLTKGMDKAAGAGFAILTFLAHGETPASKEFGPTVEKALNYLINSVHVVKDVRSLRGVRHDEEPERPCGGGEDAGPHHLGSDSHRRLELQHEAYTVRRRTGRHLLRRVGPAGAQGRQDGGHPSAGDGRMHQESRQVPQDA